VKKNKSNYYFNHILFNFGDERKGEGEGEGDEGGVVIRFGGLVFAAPIALSPPLIGLSSRIYYR
jgi:hypothetical protein